MDGFNSDGRILVLAATNLEDSLDKALKRPGRFDKIIRISSPDVKGWKDLIKLYLSKTRYCKSIDI